MSSPSSRAVALGEIARQAGAIAQACRKDLVRELKRDGSIVTNGDREVETFLRSQLAAFLPGSSVWGEEFGHDGRSDGGLWLVDPIDGTSNYSFGSPLWGISVGLEQNGRIILGAVFLPDLGELYVAEERSGAFCNGKLLPPIRGGTVQPEELVSYNDYMLRRFPDIDPPGKMRLSGAFVIDGTFVSTQRFRGLIGMRERLYDIAACLVIATECGAEIRYANGDEFDISALWEPVQIMSPWLIFPAGSGFFYEPKSARV